MMRSLVFAFLSLGLLACGGSDATESASSTKFLSLDGGSKATEAALSEGSAVDLVEANLQTRKTSPKAAAGAERHGTSSGVEALAHWHRGTAAERRQSLQRDSSAGAGLASLAQVWEGKAAAYRASLRVSEEGAFGPDFAQYASAWTEGGIAALKTALAAGPVGSVAHLVWTDVLAETSFANDDYSSAGSALATLLQEMLEAGYSRERVLELAPRIALIGRNVSAFLPSTDYTVESGDSYWVLCRKLRKSGLLVGQGWIADFNHKRNYTLRQGETLQIPQSQLSVHAWRAKRLLVVYADGIPVRIFPVSMGKQEAPTPLGAFTLDICEKEPVYYPPGGSPIPYQNPQNPLGERWLGFHEDRQYGLHGTNSEQTIGSFESGGCVRMHNKDVVELFEMLCPGLSVTISA